MKIYQLEIKISKPLKDMKLNFKDHIDELAETAQFYNNFSDYSKVKFILTSLSTINVLYIHLGRESYVDELLSELSAYMVLNCKWGIFSGVVNNMFISTSIFTEKSRKDVTKDYDK